mgnify:CR=1 FL=1
MHGKMMKNLASGYSKTVVSHWRGCIFQDFRRLQKVRKTTPEFVSKNTNSETNKALSEEMIDELSKEELKILIDNLNIKNQREKGLINVNQLASVLNDAPPELAAEILRGIDWYHASQIITKIRDMDAVG